MARHHATAGDRRGRAAASSPRPAPPTARLRTAATPATVAAGGDGDLSFAVITHGSAGDAFWDVVQNGAEAAGEDLGVAVDYQSDGDPQRQAQLIDAAVNQGVDGIVVSMANPDALQDSIEAAVDAGIPVVTINSGGDRSAEFGAIGHVGQDEAIAGQGAGRQLAAEGAANVLCVVHEAGNIGLEQRCSGASEGLGSRGDPAAGGHQRPAGRPVDDRVAAAERPEHRRRADAQLRRRRGRGRGGRGRRLRGAGRHLRPEPGRHQRHPGRRRSPSPSTSSSTSRATCRS